MTEPKSFPPTLRGLRDRLMYGTACAGLVHGLLLPALAGLTLLSVAPSAQAACTFVGTTANTYQFTSATVGTAATLDMPGTWTCYDSSNTPNYSGRICYGTTFSGSATNGSSSLAYSVALYRSLGTSDPVITSAASGSWYGIWYTASPNQTNLRFTIPANAVNTSTPAGTYVATARLDIDEQAMGGGCERSTTSWDSGNVTLTANFVVPSFCQLMTTSATMDFGNIDTVGPLATAKTANTTLTVQCNAQAPYTVYLGNGNNRASGGTGLRNMANGTARLPYQLYKDSGYSTVWDATGMGSGVTGGSGGVSQSGTGANQSLTVYGRIPQGTSIPGTLGTYNDTVVVTVAY